VRSIKITFTGAFFSTRAAARPPKPPTSSSRTTARSKARSSRTLRSRAKARNGRSRTSCYRTASASLPVHAARRCADLDTFSTGRSLWSWTTPRTANGCARRKTATRRTAGFTQRSCQDSTRARASLSSSATCSIWTRYCRVSKHQALASNALSFRSSMTRAYVHGRRCTRQSNRSRTASATWARDVAQNRGR
jgi:hypothetical protein